MTPINETNAFVDTADLLSAALLLLTTSLVASITIAVKLWPSARRVKKIADGVDCLRDDMASLQKTVMESAASISQTAESLKQSLTRADTALAESLKAVDGLRDSWNTKASH
jgi:hypothetical protein